MGAPSSSSLSVSTHVWGLGLILEQGKALSPKEKRATREGKLACGPAACNTQARPRAALGSCLTSRL
jgi:hypothetical protein